MPFASATRTVGRAPSVWCAGCNCQRRLTKAVCVLRAAARGLGVDVRLSVVPLDLVFDGQRLQAGAAALS